MKPESSSVGDPVMRVRGQVVEFDEHRGLGSVRTADGDTFMFHCIELDDGTRRIDIGTEVDFEVRQKFSRPEAFSIRRA